VTGIAFACASVAIAALGAYSFAGWLRLHDKRATFDTEGLEKLKRDVKAMADDLERQTRELRVSINNNLRR
jgi:hypothetical protein